MAQLELFEVSHCSCCGRALKLEIHHLDWDHENNSSGNRIALCRDCHVYTHRAGYLTRDEIEDVGYWLCYVKGLRWLDVKSA